MGDHQKHEDQARGPGILEQRMDVPDIPLSRSQHIQTDIGHYPSHRQADGQGGQKKQQGLQKPPDGNVTVLETHRPQHAQRQLLLVQIVPSRVHHDECPDQAAQDNQQPGVQVIVDIQFLEAFPHQGFPQRGHIAILPGHPGGERGAVASLPQTNHPAGLDSVGKIGSRRRGHKLKVQCLAGDARHGVFPAVNRDHIAGRRADVLRESAVQHDALRGIIQRIPRKIHQRDHGGSRFEEEQRCTFDLLPKGDFPLAGPVPFRGGHIRDSADFLFQGLLWLQREYHLPVVVHETLKRLDDYVVFGHQEGERSKNDAHRAPQADD